MVKWAGRLSKILTAMEGLGYELSRSSRLNNQKGSRFDYKDQAGSTYSIRTTNQKVQARKINNTVYEYPGWPLFLRGVQGTDYVLMGLFVRNRLRYILRYPNDIQIVGTFISPDMIKHDFGDVLIWDSHDLEKRQSFNEAESLAVA